MKEFSLITFEADFGDGVRKRSDLKCDETGRVWLEGDVHPANSAQWLFDNLSDLIKQEIVNKIGKNP